MAFKVFNVLSQLRLDTRDFTTKLKGSANEIQTFGRKIEKDLQRTSREFQKIGMALTKAFTLPLAGAAYAFQQTINSLDTLIKRGKSIGVSFNEMNQLRYIAEDNASSVDALVVSVTTFNKSLGVMTGSTRAYLDSVRAGLADELKAAGGTRERLLLLADALEGESVTGDKAAAAMMLLGRAGKDLIATLVQGKPAMEEMLSNADKFTLSLTDEESKKVEDMSNAFQNLGEQIKRAFFEGIRPLIPAMQTLMQTIANGLVVVNNFAQRHATLTKTFSASVLIILSVGSAAGTALLALAALSSGVAWLASAAANNTLAARALAAAILQMKAAAYGSIDKFRLLIRVIMMLTKEIWSLTASMMVNPLTLWITAITLVGLAIGAVLSPRIRQSIVDFRDWVGSMKLVRVWTDYLFVSLTLLWESFKVTGIFAMKTMENVIISIARLITGVIGTLMQAIAFITGSDLAKKITDDLGQIHASLKVDYDRNRQTIDNSSSNAMANVKAASDQAIWSKQAVEELKGIGKDLKADRDARAGKPGAIKTSAFAM